MHLIYLIHEFQKFSTSWITEINELFQDILIYWDAPVYVFKEINTFIQQGSINFIKSDNKSFVMLQKIYVKCCSFESVNIKKRWFEMLIIFHNINDFTYIFDQTNAALVNM